MTGVKVKCHSVALALDPAPGFMTPDLLDGIVTFTI